MPRTPPSPADSTLVEHARRCGVTVTARQLERWRGVGLLPANVPTSLGRGRGRTSTPAPGAAELVVWLGQHARPGRRPTDLALLAFGEGLAVPEATVRDAMRTAVQTPLPAETALPAPADDRDRVEWAWTVAARTTTASSPTLLPRRVRRIDALLRAEGISMAAPEIAVFDKGPTDADVEPLTGRDLAEFSVAAVLAGGGELAGPALAPRVRAMLPAGAASPVASWLEHSDGPGRDPSEITDGAGLTLLPTGDGRLDQLRYLDAAPVERLRLAWHAASAMHRWARDLCTAVERELSSGQPGPALAEWMLGIALGLGRVLLIAALRSRSTPAARASTALMLLGIGEGVRRIPILVPNAQVHLLPAILPPFLHTLAGVNQVDADPGQASHRRQGEKKPP